MIHPTAIISDKAKIGKNVSIGAYSIIHDNVVIADNTIIESYCELGVSNHLSGGHALIIGEDSYIRSRSTFYEGSIFGNKLVTGHSVTVREKTIAGENFQLGTLSDIQGHCKIGDYVRTHSNVHIGQHSQIGNFVWLFPYVVLTNDPHPPSNVMQGVTVGDFAVIATMSVVLPGTKIAEGVFIGAHSCIGGRTEPDMLYTGSPAKKIGPASKIKLKDGSKQPAYPWRKHFHRGYPESITSQWCMELSENV
ncbi:N-acetyltransferase [Vibrio cholerae]|uniref:acyltransferase n=2 Tax=Vibrio cholerae TaxID=666 RepID=UPI000BA98F88|nr:acyltransferase [Vibrio cholerae]MBU5690555.1 N-acetyltransferase [Vibrio cholerae]MCD1193031.1 N-acetyltransferase [Vibrio cholerae]MCD6670076.1 N-acetyltransferase [Vibrio cholerae]PAS04596.1 N-acetyltransferase [Vibrio cholerae]BCN19196.1 putative acyltransferase [Vibrio cholerae]